MTTMPFGKHRGRAVADLPKSYLKWLLGACENLEPWLARAVRVELGQRGERYVNALAVLGDVEETLTEAVSADPAIGSDLAGVVNDHVLDTIEVIWEKYGITAQTELVIPGRRVREEEAPCPA